MISCHFTSRYVVKKYKVCVYEVVWSGRSGRGGQNLDEEFMRAIQMFMGEQIANATGQTITKALKAVIIINIYF